MIFWVDCGVCLTLGGSYYKDPAHRMMNQVYAAGNMAVSNPPEKYPDSS